MKFLMLVTVIASATNAASISKLTNPHTCDDIPWRIIYQYCKPGKLVGDKTSLPFNFTFTITRDLSSYDFCSDIKPQEQKKTLEVTLANVTHCFKDSMKAKEKLEQEYDLVIMDTAKGNKFFEEQDVYFQKTQERKKQEQQEKMEKAKSEQEQKQQDKLKAFDQETANIATKHSEQEKSEQQQADEDWENFLKEQAAAEALLDQHNAEYDKVNMITQNNDSEQIKDNAEKEKADKKAKEEADKKAKEEADKKAKEEADKKAKEADKKAKQEADMKAKEEENDKKIKKENEEPADKIETEEVAGQKGIVEEKGAVSEGCYDPTLIYPVEKKQECVDGKRLAKKYVLIELSKCKKNEHYIYEDC
eukprot:Pgem_evm1s4264